MLHQHSILSRLVADLRGHTQELLAHMDSLRADIERLRAMEPKMVHGDGRLKVTMPPITHAEEG
jgi:hypothetical protein